MKVLFAIVDGGGNIPPQLAVARALASRGVEVRVLGHRGIRQRSNHSPKDSISIPPCSGRWPPS